MWQGIMKAWSTIQSGLEQQDPTSWCEVAWQPLFGNWFLTNEVGVKRGTEPRSNMLWWSEKEFKTLKDIARLDGHGWKSFAELLRLRRTRVAPPLYARVVHSIPGDATPMPPPTIGQGLAKKEEDGSINTIYHLQHTTPLHATTYCKDPFEQLRLLSQHNPLFEGTREIQLVRNEGPKRVVIDYNPSEEPESEQALWLWGNDSLCNLEWDPKKWLWRRIGILAKTTTLNYTTKKGDMVALRQDNN